MDQRSLRSLVVSKRWMRSLRLSGVGSIQPNWKYDVPGKVTRELEAVFQNYVKAHLLRAGFPRSGIDRRPVSLQAKLAVRAEAHQFQTGGIRLAVDEDQVGLEMTIAKIALFA